MVGARATSAAAHNREDRARRRPRLPPRLTRAELRVAVEIASGRTNREIAEHLFLSPRTVEAHLRAIFRKLDVRTRTELAVRVALPELGSGVTARTVTQASRTRLAPRLVGHGDRASANLAPPVLGMTTDAPGP